MSLSRSLHKPFGTSSCAAASRADWPEPPVLEWCLPLVHDCLSEFYRDLAQIAQEAGKTLIERHFVLWTALIHGELSHLRVDCDLLAAEARSLRVDFLACCAADRHVAAEILDASLRRFRRMPREARAHNAALLAALTRLQHEEAACAAPRNRAA
jgi:hypothetical protein